MFALIAEEVVNQCPEPVTFWPILQLKLVKVGSFIPLCTTDGCAQHLNEVAFVEEGVVIQSVPQQMGAEDAGDESAPTHRSFTVLKNFGHDLMAEVV